jgi:hypothetical protein
MLIEKHIDQSFWPFTAIGILNFNKEDKSRQKCGSTEDFSTVKSKELYLPAGTDRYDFWTGEKTSGGKE